KMARKIVAPFMLTALIVAAAPMLGCTAHAQFGEPQAPPPPPPAQPPPPPTPTPAAAAPPPPAPPAAEPPKAAVTMDKGRLALPGNIVYETGKAIIKPESEPTLNALK